MDWLSKLAREAKDQESSTKASERDNEATFNRVYSQFNSAIASQFDEFATALKLIQPLPKCDFTLWNLPRRLEVLGHLKCGDVRHLVDTRGSLSQGEVLSQRIL